MCLSHRPPSSVKVGGPARMPKPWEMIVLGLAVWRVASIISNEEGPFDIFGRLRLWAGEYEVNNIRSATTWYGKGLTCIFCVSVWFGFLFFGLYMLNASLGLYLALPFALSALAIGWE